MDLDKEEMVFKESQEYKDACDEFWREHMNRVFLDLVNCTIAKRRTMEIANIYAKLEPYGA